MILYSVTNFFCYFILTSFPVGEGEGIRPQSAVFCRVAASPYPAYGFVHEGRGESIRPQCAVFCRVAASPYPAYGYVH